MKPEDFIELVEERPFQPLRLHMTNGRTHEVWHPKNAFVSEHVAALAVKREGSEFPRIRLVSIAHITEVETVPMAQN